jgi:predicted permease
MTPLAAELRLAVRALQRAPIVAMTAVFMLGTAMTLATTVAAVVNAYIFNELPYPAAERLCWIRYGSPGSDQPRGLEALDWRSLHDVVEHTVSWDLDMFYLLGGDHAESAPGAWVTRGFVDALGIRPALGRGFHDGAFLPGSENVALISHRLWTGRFGGGADVVGRTFTAYVSDRPDEAERFTIIGVLPERFWHINPYTDVLVPLRAPSYPYMARLRAGATPLLLAERILSLVRAGATAVPAGWSVNVVPAHDAHVAQVRPILRAAATAALLVLLVACANVAGLLLVRALRRRHDIAVRAALGAGHAAVARMLLAEALVLAGSATCLALFGTHAALSTLAPIVQQQLGRSAPGGFAAFAVDWRVAAFAVAANIGTVVVCTLIPLLAALRPRLLTALQQGSRSGTESPWSSRFRCGLIVFEIAASVALLATGAVMLRSMLALLRVDLGLSPERVLTASLTLRHSRYPDAAARAAAFDRIAAAIVSAPGVESAGLTTVWPLQQPRRTTVETGPEGRAAAQAAVHAVTEGYFDTLAIRVSRGRGFARTDRMGTQPVAIVGETLARRLWPEADAVGRRLALQPPDDGGEPPLEHLVVGVAGDVRQGPADSDLLDVYVPMRQAPTRFAFAVIRTAGPPAAALPAVRASLKDVDPELAADRARPLQALVDDSTARPRVLTSLLSCLALVAGAVALLGIYGVIAYAVRQREREVAVRIALGADPARVVRLFVRQGAAVVLVGLALGLTAAFAGSRLIESQLFGFGARDPATLAAVAAAFGVSGLLAAWWPARRAAAVDPASALRSE